ncbi:glycoside hydrolase family 20 zincin-like fold domain-containing protein, partial [Streptomyces sp. L7]
SSRPAPADPAIGTPDQPDDRPAPGGCPPSGRLPSRCRSSAPPCPWAARRAGGRTGHRPVHWTCCAVCCGTPGCARSAGRRLRGAAARGRAGDPVGGEPAEEALRSAARTARGDLPSGGYRLAVGQVGVGDTVALAGVGPDGLFHAAQTLRQLVTDGADHDGADGSWHRWSYATARHGGARHHRGVLRPGRGAGRSGSPSWTSGPHQAEPLSVRALGDDPYRQAAGATCTRPRSEDFRALAERPAPTTSRWAGRSLPGQAAVLLVR